MSIGNRQISKKKKTVRLQIALSEYIWWMLGRGYSEYYISADEESRRYLKKLGPLRITKKDKNNGTEE